MKIIKYIDKLLIVIGLLSLFSCTKGFEEFNKDPNSFNEAPTENLFAGVVKNSLDLIGGTLNDRMFSQYANYQGGKGGQFQRYGYTEGVDDRWKEFYVEILKNNQEIIDNNSDDPSHANRVHIAKIWKSYVYSVLVSTFGGVPMSDAFGVKTTATYDSEEQIYTAILSMLKEAAEGIDPAGDQLGQDPIFNGDNNMWVKFANSLRLKIALRISEGFPTLAQEHGSAAMANEAGLISSNNENIFMKWGLETENWSFNYERYVFGDLGQSSNAYINANFLLQLQTYKDPRVTVFAEPSEVPFEFLDTLLASGSTTEQVLVVYSIPYLGKLLSDQNLDAWDLQNNDDITDGTEDENYSKIGKELFMGIDMKHHILSFAEMNFIKAEAVLQGWGGSQTAEDYYYAGIDASFEQYGLSGVDAYKAQDGIQWGTASQGLRDIYGVVSSGISDEPLDKIVRQRWVAMFDQGHDTWCMQKRTRILPFTPHFNPDGSYGNATHAYIPERMVYNPKEMGINPVAYAAALSALGGPDEMTTPLKMNKAYVAINWENLPAAYNMDFATQYYGNSVDDLIAAGVEYEIIEVGK